MTGRCLRTIYCAFTALVFNMLSCAAHGLELDRWQRYNSEHFTLISDQSTRVAQRLLKQFEQFRQAALSFAAITEQEEGERTHIYLFKHAEHYRLVQPDTAIAGYYKNTLQGARLVVGPQASLDELGLVLFHEYTHHLTRYHQKTQRPLWYEEGFADLLAAVQLQGRSAIFGRTNPWREQLLERHEPLPLRELLRGPSAEKSRQYWKRYYASAWLFTHYLHFELLGSEPDRLRRLEHLFAALEATNEPIEGLTKVLALSEQQLDERLRSYANEKYWKGFKVATAPSHNAISAQRLSQNEVVFLIADLAYRSAQPQAALALLQRGDGSDKSFAAALSLRAVLELHRGQHELAHHYMNMAQTMDANNAQVLTNAAHIAWDTSTVAEQSQRRGQLLAKVASAAQRALQLQGTNLEAARYLARAWQQQGHDGKAIALMRALHEQHPMDAQLSFELGKLLLNYDRPILARRYLNKVIAWDHSEARRWAAQQLLLESRAKPAVELSAAEQNGLRINN